MLVFVAFEIVFSVRRFGVSRSFGCMKVKNSEVNRALKFRGNTKLSMSCIPRITSCSDNAFELVVHLSCIVHAPLPAQRSWLFLAASCGFTALSIRNVTGGKST